MRYCCSNYQLFPSENKHVAGAHSSKVRYDMSSENPWVWGVTAVRNLSYFGQGMLIALLYSDAVKVGEYRSSEF